MISLDNQPCPICAQTKSEAFHRTRYPEHGYPGPFILRRCNGCGLLFNSPRLDQAELGRLYGQNYYFFLRNAGQEFDRIVAMHQRTIGLIDSKVEVKRSLDIGCGRGYFPAVLKQLGWNACGVEISDSASESARKRFGLDVFTGTIEQYVASDNAKQFPVVTAIDVIEHVSSPEDFLWSVSRAVEPGGWLVIDTPNALARNIALQGVAWKGFNPFHIYLFAIENLTALLKRHRFNVELSFSYNNTPSSTSISEKIRTGLKAIGMAAPAASLYFAMKKLGLRDEDPLPHAKLAAEHIAQQPAYGASADSRAELAASKLGENIVVIARKS